MGASQSGETTPCFQEALEKACAAPAEDQLNVLLEGISEEERAALKHALADLSSNAISHLPKPKASAPTDVEGAAEVAEAAGEPAAEEAPTDTAAAAPAAEAPKEEAAEAPKEEGGLNETQVANVRAAFDAIDVDKSGTIEVKELASVMKALDVNLSEEEVSAVFSKLDIDGNGTLDFDEYLKMVQAALKK